MLSLYTAYVSCIQNELVLIGDPVNRHDLAQKYLSPKSRGYLIISQC